MKRLQQLDTRIPSWDPEHLADRRCPFCGEEGRECCVRPDGLTVRSCSTCGALFVSPAPPESELNALYIDYSAQHSRKAPPNPRAILHARPWDDFRLAELASHLDFPGKRVLDVGCSSGMLLKRFEKLGAHVAGIDLDPTAVRFARERIGISTARVGTLEDLPRHELFDVVCMFDFIEHPLDPLRQLERAADLLAPRGIIAIWTPNAPSTPDEDEAVALRVDFEHMQYMSTRTCQWLAGKLGLQVLHVESVGFPHLNGLTAPQRRNGKHGIVKTIRNAARGLPGWHALRAIAGRLVPGKLPDARRGTYHLFCILQRGA
jgi:2-polyprenyl-3-methyl-5-hydroxy-6-metoxy-1,4-benzoquinol methylase